MLRRDEITVKDPNQIKSATDNRGTFTESEIILLAKRAVDPRQVDAYWAKTGAPATAERTQTSERISRALSQSTTGRVAEYSQLDFFEGAQTQQLGLSFSQAAENAAKVALSTGTAKSGSQAGTGNPNLPSVSQDLINGLKGGLASPRAGNRQ